VGDTTQMYASTPSSMSDTVLERWRGKSVRQKGGGVDERDVWLFSSVLRDSAGVVLSGRKKMKQKTDDESGV
jgi:hypothetical protein